MHKLTFLAKDVNLIDVCISQCNTAYSRYYVRFLNSVLRKVLCSEMGSE
jgi:hypothetical protein